MALTERDKNQLVDLGKDGKRKIDAIDLTGDDEHGTHTLKVRKRASAHNSGHVKGQKTSRQGVAAYQTPPASSAPRSSQLHDGQHSQAERDSWLADDNDDEVNEMFSATQIADSNTEQLQRFGSMPTKIVGIQYYRGHANPGEQVLLRREPNNPYDKNAIRVDNAGGTQIGHIPRKVAEKLAHYMDKSSLHVEGELAGSIRTFDCPIQVHLYGPDPQSKEGLSLAAEMKADKLPLDGFREAEKAQKQREKDQKEAEKRRLAAERRNAAMAGSGSGGRVPSGNQYGYANQTQAGLDSKPIMEDILEASQRFNPRAIGETTDQHGTQEEALKNMPLADRPAGIKTEMLPYQLQALRWLLDQEDPRLPSSASANAVQLWKVDSKGLYTNIATNYSTKDAPRLASGGILADDMGLGKTLEMISLIVAEKERTERAGTTLILCPLSVMSNWSGQIAHHLYEGKALNVYIYHGTNRVHMEREDFERYDVIITTYGTLASDYSPKGKSKHPEQQLRSSGLYSMEWRRVILDEGHTVRNPASKGAAAVTALIAQSRWVLTGTPIVNSLKDLYSLLHFIGIRGGIENLEMFNRVLVRPLKQGDASATFLLKAVMTAFTLRRRKEMKFIDLRLPKLDEYVHRIEFTKKEHECYEALEAQAQGMLKRYENKAGQAGRGAGEAFQGLLEILLRMRQCCNHWQMCGERVTNLLAQLEEQQTVDITSENKKALQDLLQVQIESQEDCAICLETLHNPVITTCAHAFGSDCISKVIETQGKCPMCRAALDESKMVGPANDCGDESPEDGLDITHSSTKLESMMEILAATRSREGDKTIIFSQWTRFLDIVESRLVREGYKYCRIDGTMRADRRDNALHALEADPECTIMLASLGVCAVGLNLTAANQIILSDTWWAPAIEDQAVDRVHRLGQTKETRVFRLVMDKSIEENTIAIQTEKRKLMMLAFSERSGKRDQARQGRLADIQKLLRGSGKDKDEGHAGEGAAAAEEGNEESCSGSCSSRTHGRGRKKTKA